ncbi:cytochrome b561 and DOMON domain-containing protein At5g47530-like [Neltuma alba]|uniref:cytochrome b561 and DOMON domain-containing protein At5g47530-like n=1 Tax=Neltuma alba TaxID=207710 RepID=UPI0010A3A6C7|nr:cytochrome b561 and DOMON domain-containing protein At5g47530-like [Prosopis alba]
MGAITARYLKAFEASGSTWFHLHRACQILAYLIGTSGFALGLFISNLSLSSLSPSAFLHASIGIAIFVSSTVQVLVAVFLRPHKRHGSRIFWNIFHYVVGYGVIALAIFNMFRGFSISGSYYHSWKNAYFGIIVSLGCLALVLEVLTCCFLACKRRNNQNQKKEISEDDNVASHQEI